MTNEGGQTPPSRSSPGGPGFVPPTLEELQAQIPQYEILALLAVSAFVVLTGLLGMLTSIITSLNERRREMAILRAVGARPWHIFALLLSEAVLLAAAGVLLGLLLIYLLLWVARPIVESQFGVVIGIAAPTGYDAVVALVVVSAAFVFGAGPAWRAYRNSLADGMTIRL